MRSKRHLNRDKAGISSFSLLAIIVLLFASFTVAYQSYVTNIDSSYRIKMNEMTKMEIKTSEAIQDLETHAVYLAQRSIDKGEVNKFEDDFDDYVDRLGSEGFDVWKGGDVTIAIDGIYAVYGGTIKENYTVRLAQNTASEGEGYRVNGTFHITVSNLRTSMTLSKVLEFEKMIYPPYFEFP